MGGDDRPENIAYLTIEEHADAHKKLYDEHGLLEDYLAWKGLTGQISKKEILVEIYKKNGHTQGKKNKGKTPWNKGVPMSDDQRKKLSKPKSDKHKEAMRKPKTKTDNMGKYERTPEHKKRLSEATKKQFSTEEFRRLHSERIKRVVSTCVHCGLTSVPGNINRWHNDNCKKIKE
jgi:hypothetical protein